MLNVEPRDKAMLENELSDRTDSLTPWFSTRELLEYLGISETELAEQANLIDVMYAGKKLLPNGMIRFMVIGK